MDQMGNMTMRNPVGQIDVDITVDQAPDYVSLRAEQFERLTDLAKSGFPIPPMAIIEASDLRDKKKLIEAMQPQQQDPQQAQMGMRGAMAEIAVKEMQAEKNKASAMKDVASIPAIQAQAVGAQIEAQAKTFIARRAGL